MFREIQLRVKKLLCGCDHILIVTKIDQKKMSVGDAKELERLFHQYDEDKDGLLNKQFVIQLSQQMSSFILF